VPYKAIYWYNAAALYNYVRTHTHTNILRPSSIVYKYTICIALKSTRISVHVVALLRCNVKKITKDMHFEMPFKCQKDLWITNGNVKRIPNSRVVKLLLES